jgi:hypothetical protein
MRHTAVRRSGSLIASGICQDKARDQRRIRAILAGSLRNLQPRLLEKGRCRVQWHESVFSIELVPRALGRRWKGRAKQVMTPPPAATKTCGYKGRTSERLALLRLKWTLRLRQRLRSNRRLRGRRPAQLQVKDGALERKSHRGHALTENESRSHHLRWRGRRAGDRQEYTRQAAGGRLTLLRATGTFSVARRAAGAARLWRMSPDSPVAPTSLCIFVRSQARLQRLYAPSISAPCEHRQCIKPARLEPICAMARAPAAKRKPHTRYSSLKVS